MRSEATQHIGQASNQTTFTDQPRYVRCGCDAGRDRSARVKGGRQLIRLEAGLAQRLTIQSFDDLVRKRDRRLMQCHYRACCVQASINDWK